jgi:hypothetical protein
MNCLTARQTLELAARDEPDADDRTRGNRSRETVEEAALHVEACPACRTAVRRQRQFDDKVGVMIREAPVPSDLKERLLARLEAEARTRITDRADAMIFPAAASPGAGPVVAVPAADRSPVGSRRRWLKSIGLAAACLVVGVATWSLWPSRPAISLDHVVDRLTMGGITPNGMPAYPQFANGQAPRLPGTMMSGGLGRTPRQLDDLDVAVFFFPRSSRRGPLDGRLAVVPKRRVAVGKLPAATSFLGPPELVTYKGAYCVTAWVEGESVYIFCCLKRGEDELHRLIPGMPT